MASLKEEQPFAFIVATDFLDKICSFCFTSGIVPTCVGCHLVSYCNKNCQKNDWVNHKNECPVLKKGTVSKKLSGRAPGNHARLAIRILLKSKEELMEKSFNGRTYDSLETRGEIPSDFNSEVDYIIGLLKSVKEVTRAEVENALRKVITNGLEILDSIGGIATIGFGVYLGLSVHNHSCIPDSQIIFTGKKATLHIFEETADYSPNLTISRVNLTPWAPHRKSLFRQEFFCDCTCLLCTDENHIMNRMGSSCYVSCCEDAAGILDENSSGPYRCNKCGKASTITVNEIKRAEEKIVQEVEGEMEAENSSDLKMMNLLMTNEKVLSVYNFQYISLCSRVRSMALTNDFHGMRRYIQDKELKAVDYYLHEKDRSRALILIMRVFLKYSLINADDYDESKAKNAMESAFGRDHPVAVKFRESNEYYHGSGLMQSLVRLALQKFAEADPLLKFFL